jgi:hypothetical protein
MFVFILVDTTPVLVLDNGSAFLKAGFSDQPLPKEVVSSVVGTPLRYSQDIAGMEYNAKSGLAFGHEAMLKAGVMHIGTWYECFFRTVNKLHIPHSKVFLVWEMVHCH